MTAPILALAFAFSLAPVPENKNAPETKNITGKYDAEGVDISGKKYTSRVTIATEGDAFRISWAGPSGNFEGVGLRTGKTISVSWATPTANGVMVGVLVYEVKKDGSLDGKWSILGGKGKLGTEVLIPIAE